MVGFWMCCSLEDRPTQNVSLCFSTGKQGVHRGCHGLDLSRPVPRSQGQDWQSRVTALRYCVEIRDPRQKCVPCDCPLNLPYQRPSKTQTHSHFVSRCCKTSKVFSVCEPCSIGPALLPFSLKAPFISYPAQQVSESDSRRCEMRMCSEL